VKFVVLMNCFFSRLYGAAGADSLPST